MDILLKYGIVDINSAEDLLESGKLVIPDADSILDKYNIKKNKKYVLILCTIEPRKNLIIVIITFYQSKLLSLI